MACSLQKERVDLVVHNATVYTVDANFSTVGAFAVEEGRIVAVGTLDDLLQKYDPGEMFDAGGKTIVPGLIDAHCHFYGLGLNQQLVDLVGTQSFGEVIGKIKSFHVENPSNVLRGRGWDQNDWAVKRFPTKTKLDSLFPNIPVVLERVDGHAYLVNQNVLDMAGITATTQVDGGEVVLDGNGDMTGVLIDNPMGMVDAVMPKPDRASQIKALKEAENICFSYGLTTVNDAGLDRSTIELMDSLQKTGDLKIRVYAMLSNKAANLDYYLPKGPVKTDRLHVCSVKVYGDGALGSRGATLKRPYADKPGHHGAMVTPVDEIGNLAERLAKSGFQMNTHAIGDSANVVVLRAYEKALRGMGDRRWKIEHAQVLDTPDFAFFEKGIIPSVQPTHATSDMYWAQDRVGPERINGAYAFKTLLNKAGLVALGTDFPVEQVSPFLTFYAAVTRQDVQGFPKGGFLPVERLSREEALKGMTIWAAYSNFEETEKGSIEVGKWADFTILDRDIMKVPVEDIPALQAAATYVAGERVK
ncbi:MAG: amidohydrolase [Flavobacteriaceae bacterium]